MNRPTRFIPFFTFALGLVLAAAVPATAAAAGFIKIAGIDGETRDAAHKGEIEVLSYSWGESRAGGQPSSSGSKRQHGWITITKSVDKASPKLMEASTNGKVFRNVTLFLPDAQDARAAYMKIELENVLVSSYAVSGAGGGSQTETFSLNYEKIKQEKPAAKADVKASSTPDSPADSR